MRLAKYFFVALGFAVMMHTTDLLAQAQYLLSWRGLAYTTGAGGKIITARFSEKDLINKVAADNGLSPSDLTFVYRVDARDTAVVRKSDGGFVADVIQLQYNYVDVANGDDSMAVRQAMLNDEYHNGAIGSAFGSERTKRNGNGAIVSYSFRGTFQYALPETGTVYSGTFNTGKALPDRTASGG